MERGAQSEAAPGDVSQLLRAWTDGNRGPLQRLTPIVYSELRRLARWFMQHERAGHSLQTTALVHWQNRAHFFAVSARLMRRILVDHARRHNLKRENIALVDNERGEDLVGVG